MVGPEQGFEEWAARSDYRLGIGEFVDADGVMPRLLGRLQYLAAMGIECPTALEELVGVWAPCVDAMLAVAQAMKTPRPDTEGMTSPSPLDLPAGEAIIAPVVDLLGIPWSVVHRFVALWPFDQPLPADSPLYGAANAALFRAWHGHAEWMARWRLPKDDIGWIVITAGMGALWAFETATEGDAGPRVVQGVPEQRMSSDPSDDELPDLALFDDSWINDVIAVTFGPNALPIRENLPPAIGGWVMNLVETVRSETVPITIQLSWNPLLETRAKARKRLPAAAERDIAMHLKTASAERSPAGAVRTPSKTSGLEHFRWLVRHRIKKQTQKAIADKVDLNVRAVRRVLTETAELVGLPKQGVGRPRRTLA